MVEFRSPDYRHLADAGRLLTAALCLLVLANPASSAPAPVELTKNDVSLQSSYTYN